MDFLNSGAAALPQQPNLRFIFNYHLCHRVRDVFSALHKTNTSENEHLYLHRDDDLLPVGLLNCPTYHSHSSRTCHNIPRNFSINFHGNWVAFLVLEILCSLTQIVSEMNKSLFCILGKGYSKCNTPFSYFISLLNQKTFHLLNLPSAQLNKSIIFAPTMPSYWIHSCNFQIWLSAKIRDIASVFSCSSQRFSSVKPLDMTGHKRLPSACKQEHHPKDRQGIKDWNGPLRTPCAFPGHHSPITAETPPQLPSYLLKHRKTFCACGFPSPSISPK